MYFSFFRFQLIVVISFLNFSHQFCLSQNQCVNFDQLFLRFLNFFGLTFLLSGDKVLKTSNFLFFRLDLCIKSFFNLLLFKMQLLILLFRHLLASFRLVFLCNLLCRNQRSSINRVFIQLQKQVINSNTCMAHWIFKCLSKPINQNLLLFHNS